MLTLYRYSAICDIIGELEKNGIRVVIYEPILNEFCDDKLKRKRVENISEFKKISDIIVANRINNELYDVSEKVYIRDVYGNDL